METRLPALAFPVGEYLADELEAREMTAAELARAMQRPLPVVSDIIAGGQEISPDVAGQLGAALGISAQFWLNLQDRYRRWKFARDGKDA